MVSIKDVAKQAGVSIATVSKVINNYPYINEKTREKVHQAIEELHYVPNAIASSLSSKVSSRIAVLINIKKHTHAIDEIDMRYLSGAINRAKELNLDIMTVFFQMLDNMTVDEIIRYFQTQKVSGVIIYGMSKNDVVLHELIERQALKVVVIDAPTVNESTSCIHINHQSAQYDVARKCMEGNDVKSILYIAGRADGYVTQWRLEGMQKLALEESIELKAVNGDFSEYEARRITKAEAANYDMIGCASDLMAIGAVRALDEEGIKKPVCGFDGISLMGYAGSNIYTVRQNFSKISARAVDEINGLMHGEKGNVVDMDYKILKITYDDIVC